MSPASLACADDLSNAKIPPARNRSSNAFAPMKPIVAHKEMRQTYGNAKATRGTVLVMPEAKAATTSHKTNAGAMMKYGTGASQP